MIPLLSLTVIPFWKYRQDRRAALKAFVRECEEICQQAAAVGGRDA